MIIPPPDKPDTYDAILRDAQLNDFEHLCITLQEQCTENYRSLCEACLVAVETRDTNTAATLFGHTAGWVRRMANILRLFGRDAILPNIPISIYEKAARTDKPLHWLERAITKGWSARQLADAAGIAKGATVSDVPLIAAGTEGLPIVWENRVDTDGVVIAHIEIMLPDVSLSGKVPERVRMGKVVEVLK